MGCSPDLLNHLLDLSAFRERMIFRTPCCETLRRCLTCGTDRAFRRLEEKAGALFLSVYSVPGEAGGKPVPGRPLEPVLFCPFCGTRLQTAEAVIEWGRKFRGEI
jgi:hypothetical protein